MPPKRHAPSSRTKTALVPKRPSKLAKENGITADQEAEFREAFGLFAVHHPEHSDSKEGVLRRDDVRRCLISLNLGPEKSEIPEILSTIDPLKTGFVEFTPFLSYAAIALHSKGRESGDDDDEEVDEDDYHQESNTQEIQAAFKLFTHGGSGPITIAHLRRVAKELREDVPDAVLKDMIREANGGVSEGRDVGGVGIEEFEGVLKRAGLSFA